MELPMKRPGDSEVQDIMVVNDKHRRDGRRFLHIASSRPGMDAGLGGPVEGGLPRRQPAPALPRLGPL